MALARARLAAGRCRDGGVWRFLIVFFGIGAIVVGLLASFDLAGPIWMQLLLFSAISVGSLLIFRRRLLKWLQVDPQAPPVDMIVGEVGTAAEDLLPEKSAVSSCEALPGPAATSPTRHCARGALPGDSRRWADD